MGHLTCFKLHKIRYVTFLPPLSAVFQKRLKIEESVRQKMGAEQRQSNIFEQVDKYGIFNNKYLRCGPSC